MLAIIRFASECMRRHAHTLRDDACVNKDSTRLTGAATGSGDKRERARICCSFNKARDRMTYKKKTSAHSKLHVTDREFMQRKSDVLLLVGSLARHTW